MSRIWRTIRGYIWWTYSRGSLHYDIMVTLILAFIFLAPLWIDFGDKPTARIPHQTEVVILPDGENFMYEISASAVKGTSDASIREDLLRIIEPIAGEARILRYETVRDAHGQTKSYKVWVHNAYR